MLRTAILSIVLAISVGHHGALLCKAWCDPVAAAASGCHDEESASALYTIGQETCDTIVVPAASFAREYVRRDSARGPDHAMVGSRIELAPRAGGVRHEPVLKLHRVLERRPLATVLRI